MRCHTLSPSPCPSPCQPVGLCKRSVLLLGHLGITGLRGRPSPVVLGRAESRLAVPQGAEQLLGDDSPRALLTGFVVLIPVIQGLGAVTLQNAFLQRGTRPSRGWCPLLSTHLGAACAGSLKKGRGLQRGQRDRRNEEGTARKGLRQHSG